ncbi:response regulator [Virgibacillus dakarensis]|nr:response regulator [Virgibacillus dakarensis]
MRILIAEDELLERKAMIKFIEANFNDMKVVGEAPNGRRAIELAQTVKPDIIFMDIKMPGLNGLEAIEKIRQVNSAVKFILVSAYDSFAYAKQAMQFGIKEYILKPGKKEEIVRAILRVQKEILFEQKKDEETLKSNELVKEHLLTKLMKNPVDEGAKSIQRQFFPVCKNGYFLVVQMERDIPLENFYSILEKHLTTPFIMQHHDDQYTICVFTPGKVNKAEILHAARGVQLELGNDSFVGAGNPSATIDDLPKSYQEAFTACYELEKEGSRHYGFLNKKENSIHRDKSMSRLIEIIERGNDQDAVQLYKEDLRYFGTRDVDELYLRIKDMMMERGLAVPERSLSELTTEKDWEKFITACCLRMQDYYQSKQYIEKAKTFMQQHFQRSLTLEETALHVGLSPNYFSNLFKQEFGTTFIDYLTKIRLQRAKELLEENRFSLKEISSMVGYNDPNYFSRVFKKHFSESPKHFRQTILKK